MRAELVLGLAEAWHCPPSAVLAESAEVLRDLKIRQLGRAEEGGEGGDW